MEMNNLLDQLSEIKPTLTRVFRKYWDTPLEEFSSALYDVKPGRLELELEDAFKEEWLSMGISESQTSQMLAQLKNQPLLQTTQHITPTNGPGFFGIDLITLAGLKKENYYLVGANSGVAYSNSAWSGALSYNKLDLEDLLKPDTKAWFAALRSAKERSAQGDDELRLTFISAKNRDALVYSTTVQEQQKDFISSLKDEVASLFPVNATDVFTHWAVRSYSGLLEKATGRDKICYFDINRVISRYLSKVITKTDHPINSILFGENSESIIKHFESPSIFLSQYKGKKSTKVQPLYWDKGTLIGKKTEKRLSPEQLKEKLANFELCPGLFLLFFVLRFLNGIRCLGSFNQVEYLTEYSIKWKELNLDWGLYLEFSPERMLTTGRYFVDDETFWPLDLALKGDKIEPDSIKNKPMSEFWIPVVKFLLSNNK